MWGILVTYRDGEVEYLRDERTAACERFTLPTEAEAKRFAKQFHEDNYGEVLRVQASELPTTSRDPR